MRSNRTALSPLRVDRLEDRCNPAQFGTPWADPTHLTLSFAPDGTQALSSTSSLFATLDAQMPRADWQGAILHAVQTWAEAAGVNVGVAADGGQAFGVNGLPQGDSRFGDIRVGALPMAASELAQATPPDPTLAGTLSGDIYINASAAFTADSLYGVALHEVGHALGIGSSDDPASVMYDTFNRNFALSASDVAAVRGLYGARPVDSNEGNTGNGSVKNSTRIQFHSSFDGSTPLVIYGDVTAAADADVFYLPVLDTYSGPLTVRVQTAGVSLLAPTLTVLDKSGNVLAAASGSGTQGDSVSVTLPQVTAGGKYFIRVEAANGATYSVGRYAVAATFDTLNKTTPAATDAVLRGPYDSLSPQDIIGLFKNPTGTAFNDDAGTNDTLARATLLATAPGFAPNTRFRTTASIATPADLDFYKVKAPSTANNAPVVLTATVRAVAPNGAAERIELYTAAGTRLAATVLANGNGTFTVQAVGLASNASYYVRVGGAAGNYQLDVAFGSKAAALDTFGSGTAPAGGSVAAPLYLAETQVFGFTFAATGPAGTPVRLTITDAAGGTVFTLDGIAGDTVSGVTGLLAPGEYRVTVSAVGSTSPVGFTLRGSGITDPIGPQPVNSATAPQYQSPTAPGTFVYPNGVSTVSAFLFALWSVL